MTGASQVILERWSFTADTDITCTIVPDGCRDVISICAPGESIRHVLSPLANSSYEIPIAQGTKMYGLRLLPGTIVHERALFASLEQLGDQPEICADMIGGYCETQPNITEALSALRMQERASLRQVAASLGVSLRTLQRTVLQHTERTPYFWFSLSRVRRCARALTNCDSLAEAAFIAGYADQAHMTREMKKWFGVTPSAIKLQSALQWELAQSGYD